MDPPSRDVAPRKGASFSCGDLTIDVDRQVVVQAGNEIVLPKLSFDLLLALARSAPKVLSIDLLIEQAWGGAIVSPETVVQRVKLLRDALGDDSRQPRYIGAMRSRGYFLIPPLIEVAPAPSRVSPARPTPRRAIAVAALVLVLGLGALGWKLIEYQQHRSEPAAAPAVAALPAAPMNTAANTVAVMPFRNLSRDPADAFLATGLPEMILNRLSQVRNLAVVARSSSFALDPQVGDAHELGRRLNSGHLIEGNVQRDGDRVRITAQVIDVSTGTLVWSEGFDRRIGDVFALQDEIADRIAGALAQHISGLDLTPQPPGRSENVAANLSYLSGLSLLRRYTVAESEAAVPLLEKAIALDSRFVAAYAALYDAHMQAAERRHEDMAKARSRWQPLIAKALALDAKSGAAHFARAMWGSGTRAEREADFRFGLAYDPSNGRGITAYAEFLADDQERPFAEVDGMLQRALWIDPLSPRARFKRVMFSDLTAADAEKQMLEVLALDPNFHPALQRYGKYRWMFHGQLAESAAIMERAIAVDPDNPWSRHTALAIYLDLDDVEAAQDVTATTALNRQTAQLMLALRRGDWRRAGIEAYAEPTWTYGTIESWGAGEAVRDYALRSGAIDRAVKFLEQKYHLHPGPQMALDIGNFRQAAMLADLFDAESRGSEATQLRAVVANWNDVNEASGGSLFAKRLRARLWLLAGRRDAALQELAESFRAGDYVQWWYTLERDPAWIPLHDDPRFQAIAAGVHTYVAQQRALLDQMRRRGEVLRRDGMALARESAASAPISRR